MTFKEEIKKLLIDKVLLGIIVGFVIYLGSIQLEKIKANESFKSELNKARIIKIAEVWEQAAKFEADFYKLYNAVESEKYSQLLDDKITEETIYKKDEIIPFIELVGSARANLFDKIRQNSFYLGPMLESQVMEFHRSLAFVDLYQKISLNKNLLTAPEALPIEEAKNRVDHFRANISQIRDYIISGGW